MDPIDALLEEYRNNPYGDGAKKIAAHLQANEPASPRLAMYRRWQQKREIENAGMERYQQAGVAAGKDELVEPPFDLEEEIAFDEWWDDYWAAWERDKQALAGRLPSFFSRLHAEYLFLEGAAPASWLLDADWIDGVLREPCSRWLTQLAARHSGPRRPSDRLCKDLSLFCFSPLAAGLTKFSVVGDCYTPAELEPLVDPACRLNRVTFFSFISQPVPLDLAIRMSETGGTRFFVLYSSRPPVGDPAAVAEAKAAGKLQRWMWLDIPSESAPIEGGTHV